MEAWHIIVTLGIIAFIIEIFTAGFVAGSVGIGLILSAIANYLGMDLKWQILAFAMGVSLTYFLIRPVILKYGYQKEGVKTNKDALIDKKGIVSEEINPEKNTGHVKIDGDEWQARSTVNEIIRKGEEVKVVYIESIVLFVKKS
ncbi:MAG: NfeD family protein [Bacteroidales bacterium]|nr:NfeD family protein [Bacteroidales bacterium]